MTDPVLLADVFVSLAALIGVLIVAFDLASRRTPDPLSRRFTFGLWVLAVLLAARIAYWTTGLWLFQMTVITAAGLVPLAALILTEGLLRRHAPREMKVSAAIATILVLALAPLPHSLVEPWRIIFVLGYQAAMFFAVAWMVLERDRDSLSPAENQMVDRIALSLILILPLLITDYRSGFIPVPVRLGGIAILFLCWLAVSLQRSNGMHRDILVALAALTIGAFAAGTIIAGISGTGWVGAVQAVAVVLSASLAAAIYVDSASLRNEERRDSLLRHLAHGDISDTKAFLRGLQNHVLVNGALALGDAELKEFDTRILTRLFADDPVRSAGNIKLAANLDEDAREQLSFLFEQYEATHAMLVATAPLSIVVLSMPSIGAAPGAETELRAVQRMALLISEQEAGHPPATGSD